MNEIELAVRLAGAGSLGNQLGGRIKLRIEHVMSEEALALSPRRIAVSCVTVAPWERLRPLLLTAGPTRWAPHRCHRLQRALDQDDDGDDEISRLRNERAGSTSRLEEPSPEAGGVASHLAIKMCESAVHGSRSVDLASAGLICISRVQERGTRLIQMLALPRFRQGWRHVGASFARCMAVAVPTVCMTHIT